jgi:hypothetical protein
MWKREPKRVNSIAGLNPVFRSALMKILGAMVERGFDPVVFETTRTQERQNWLYLIGRRGKRGEKPVTGTLKSRHIYGKAADIISKRNWWNDVKFFNALEDVAAEHGCRTLDGDRCHVELLD